MGEKTEPVCVLVMYMENGERAEGPVFYLVLQLGQEKREQMLHGVVLAQDSGETHDDWGQGRLYMLICVWHQLLLDTQKERDEEKTNEPIHSQVVLIRDMMTKNTSWQHLTTFHCKSQRYSENMREQN